MLDAGYYPRRTPTGAKRKYPWDELEVGETFEVKQKSVYDFCSTLGYANRSRAPKRFTSKSRGPDLIIRRVK